MKTEITIQKDKLLAAYNGASDEQKRLLESMYGKDTFKSENVMDRIKTFDDACKELGDIHSFVVAFKIAKVNGAFGPDIIAYLKLRIICAALNEGWKPKNDKDEHRYYPWFYIYSKDEYDALSDKEKKECFVVARRSCYDSGTYGGVSYVDVVRTSSHASVGYGARLALKTRELAEYFGKQFIDIWADYLFY